MNELIQQARLRASWWRWRLKHPGRTFEEFYVARVEEGLARGGAHPTLGTNRSDAHWFDESARRQLTFLKERGLQPDSRLIDFGCGSLRLGRVLVDFLEPNNYRAVDVTDKFFKAALSELPDGWQADNGVQFDVAGPELPGRLRAWKTDFLVSIAVLMHIPPKGLDQFLADILASIPAGAECLITFKATPKSVLLAPTTWGYTESDLISRAKALGAAAQVLHDPDNEDILGYKDGKYSILSLRVAEHLP